jgi:hypothetical protein
MVNEKDVKWGKGEGKEHDERKKRKNRRSGYFPWVGY